LCQTPFIPVLAAASTAAPPQFIDRSRPFSAGASGGVLGRIVTVITEQAAARYYTLV
jgi:hypothetical protein